MGAESVLLALCNIGTSKRVTAVQRALSEYGNLLAEIYNDIYESCIKVYYSSYKPTRYKRHGDIVGFNLYSAFYSDVHDIRIDATLDADNLLPYGSATRDEVLDTVINGQRGTKHRVTKFGTWPQRWSVKYPNAFSKLSIWQSRESTIDAILMDFANNGIKDTTPIFFKILSRYV